jgi:putative transposase
MSRGGLCYHVMNRGNERQAIFHDDNEYTSFMQLLQRVRKQQPIRILALCLMPNHFHLCLYPHNDGDLGRFMQRVTTAHVSQFRRTYPGVGHVWQGRFKAFAAQDDAHLMNVLAYIERNPVRAGLAERAEQWEWSSAFVRLQPIEATRNSVVLDDWPVPRPADWLERINRSEREDVLAAIRKCALRDAPYGSAEWIARVRT